MAARKKTTARRKTTKRAVKRKTTTVRRKRASFARKPATKRTTAKRPAKKVASRTVKKGRTSSADLKLDAIKRDADAQVICSVLLELGINHHELSTDKDYMKVTMSPKDAVAFYSLLLKEIARPFKEAIDCSYKTNSADWVIVSVPVSVMKDVNKVLSTTLKAAK